MLSTLHELPSVGSRYQVNTYCTFLKTELTVNLSQDALRERFER